MTADRGQRFDQRARSHSGSRLRALTRPLGRADTAVGLTMLESMMMTPGAQANEMARINSDMNLFATEIADAVHARGDTTPRDPLSPANFADYVKARAAQTPAIAADPVIAMYHAVWLPIWQAWTRFYADNKDGAWWSNPVSEAEKYQDQLIDLRARAASLGVKLMSPGPKQEHPEGLPSWLLPVGVGVGALIVLSALAKSS